MEFGSGWRSSFHYKFSKLVGKLKDKGKVNEVSSHFSPSHTLADMFSYLWNLEEIQKGLSPDSVSAVKSSVEAERLRSEGNQCYKKKLLDKALQYYNQSIMFAPHPELGCSVISEQDDNQDLYRPLSLGYANRSAVLYELKLYEKCVHDIEMALHYGYPKILHCKLAERKAKCLMYQEKQAEAKEVVEASLQLLKSCQLDESKTKASKESLEQLLHQVNDKNSEGKTLNMSVNKSTIPSVDVDNSFLKFDTPAPPKLTEPNAKIPSLSSAVKLAFSPTQGRYMVAERNIKPGELLVVEEGYSRVLHLDSHLLSHCSGCLDRCITPLPCPTCPTVIFCSNACRAEALTLYHSRECSALASLSALDIGKNAVLAYRILTQTSFARVRKLVPLYRHEAESKAHKELGFNEDGTYDSADYRTIYHLVGNKENRTVSDLFKRCAMSVALVKLLEQSGQFFVDRDGDGGGGGGRTITPTQYYSDILLTGTTLFTHMMNLPCNAHSLTEFQVVEGNSQASASEEIGCGAFGVLSLTNHSCNPSTVRVSYGGVEVLRAIRYIPAGSEVTDSYGELCGMLPVQDRKANLLKQYYFTCSCEPCQQKWPVYFDMPTKRLLKCLKCLKPLDCKLGKCVRCKLSYLGSVKDGSLDADTYDWKKVDKEVTRAVKKYQHSYAEVLQGINSPEIRDSICKVIELLDKYVMLPYQTYFEAQETLKHCYDYLGSYNVKVGINSK